MNTRFSISEILIIVLLVILLSKSCKNNTTVIPTIIKTKDTVWVYNDSTIYNKPELIKTIPFPVDKHTIEYIPDTNYSKLIKQYTELIDKFLAYNIHKDSIRIDSIGYVRVTDTVSKNMIIGRSTKYNLKYPTVTIKETITIPEKKRGQVYIGLGAYGYEKEPVTGLNAGLFYKNKRDFMFGSNIGVQKDGTVMYGIQSYWKIKIKK